MLVPATLIAVCAAAILFLIRFLIALESDALRVRGRVERISTRRAKARAGKSATKLILVHSNPEQQGANTPGGVRGSLVSPEANSRSARM